MRKALLALALATTATIARGQSTQPAFVPFVIPAIQPADSLAAFHPSPAIAPDAHRIVVDGSHFSLDGKRLKFWAVNLTFSANFPDHDNAKLLAERLAAGGVNCVRLHHMDSQAFDAERHAGIWQAGTDHLSPEAMDRLDFLIDQLARHGIYADCNLHVSRTHSQFLKLPPNPGESYDKMIDLFTPQLIDAQKAYATKLLGHVNAYRHVRYADDPAIAIVEISNEDSLFMWGARPHLKTLPAFYANLLRSQYNDWLTKKYGSMNILQAAWSPGAQPLGADILQGGTVPQPGKPWLLQVQPGNTVDVQPTTDVCRIDIHSADKTEWHVQLIQSDLQITAGKYYTVTFVARADKPRRIGVNVREPRTYSSIGCDELIDLTPDWKPIHIGFTATQTLNGAQFVFDLGGQSIPVELKDLHLQPGGQTSVAADESLDAHNIAVFATTPTPARALDTEAFLLDTESAFWNGMYAFIKQDIKCPAMVTGTIAFGPMGLAGQAKMDFIDAHAYWHHPSFPGKPWDMHNFIVAQGAMVDEPENAELFKLAASRLAGKPFTVTEYQHPAPNDFQAECVPMISSFAAAQDWDGVWLFDYGDVPSDDRMHSFFDIGGNPSKWGFMSIGAAIFRDGMIPPAEQLQTLSLAPTGDPLTTWATMNATNATNLFKDEQSLGFTWHDFVQSKIAIVLQGERPAAGNSHVHVARPINWWADPKSSLFDVAGAGAKVFIIHATKTKAEKSQPFFDVDGSNVFAVIAMASLDGQPFVQSHRVLIAACKRCENQDMKYSADRTRVVANFGNGPVQIEAVSTTLSWPRELPAAGWSMVPLDASGHPIGAARPVTKTIDLQPSDKTMWWALQR